ncbi:putative damage-inducible protein DinB [Nocardiopsis arvandica]|uniref:Putative damage-inducible protein DinB n=1 Tax=Nocardiopsis sinuspersici TaxID=501010 RepID=A0A7Z0BIA2_9ACTN|nr:DinB family protein [Nocardiopsis sinuspersici]NYH52473.1 putative damage-inducible protein DinB [Nocardiopsis sinuspersici]
MAATTENTVLDAERTSLLRVLGEQRDFLRFTLRDLDDAQAAKRTTASELTLGGLVKHVTLVERNWIRFIREGAMHDADVDYEDPSAFEEQVKSFRLLGDETLAGALEDYERAAEETDRFVAQLPDLEVGHELPKAPWFPENTSWSARDVLLHMIRETAQHCGHADILRESLDGQKTMG